MNTQVLGISVDSIPTLKAWAQSLGGIEYPLLSDFWPHGAVSQRYHVLNQNGISDRAIFVIDRGGCIRYINVYEKGVLPDNDVLFKAIQRIDPQAYARSQQGTESEQLPGGDGIVLYCTSWCPDCKRARQWLKEHNLVYVEVDIDVSSAASQRLKSWTGGMRTTPTFDFGGEQVIGFDRLELERTAGNWLRQGR